MLALLFYILMAIATYFYIRLQERTLAQLRMKEVSTGNNIVALEVWIHDNKPHLHYTDQLQIRFDLTTGEWATVWPFYWIALIANDLTHEFKGHESVLLETWAQSRAERCYKKFRQSQFPPTITVESERHP